MAETVTVRRQWNDHRSATYRLDALSGVHWSDISGGLNAIAPTSFLHGYVWCDQMIAGELPHSCAHGRGPHSIKVCVLRKDNKPKVFELLEAIAGPRPSAPPIKRRLRRIVNPETGLIEVYELPQKRLRKVWQQSVDWIIENAELIARRGPDKRWRGPDGERVDGRLYASQRLVP